MYVVTSFVNIRCDVGDGILYVFVCTIVFYFVITVLNLPSSILSTPQRETISADCLVSVIPGLALGQADDYEHMYFSC